MRIRHSLLAATALTALAGALPGGAQAQPVTGPYVGLGAGWNQPLDRLGADVRNGFTGLPNGRGKTEFSGGWTGVLALGWGFGNGVRAELEGNYRANDLDKLRGYGAAPFGRIGGVQRSYGVMGNAYYDFDFSNFGLAPSFVQPYLGVGAGYVWTEWRNIRATSIPAGAVLTSNDTSSGRFAYQGIAGLAFPLTQFGVTGLSLTAEYRFLGTLDQHIQGQLRTPAGGVISTGKLNVENMNHSVLIGLRYAFNQPPPPPPPVAAPAPVQAAPAQQPARTFLVFFDWDRADLTARAREIVNEAAQNARRAQATRIEVAGHADRSGSPQYNERLSQRRAEAVAGELVRQGVRREDISISAFGESRPLVPTADGVREPQNRRVEIVLR